MAELIWDGKYDAHGNKRAPVRIELPFQTVETVNESAQERQRTLELSSSGNDAEWRNRLIWGDKKYVLPSLLPEFAGKVDLIYIDPPFDTGADFSFMAEVPPLDPKNNGEVSFHKEPSILELKAYRDTWGRGLDSYLQWFQETCVLLRDLLAEGGSLIVHLDYRVGQYAKVALDETFGIDNLVNELIWYYTGAGVPADRPARRYDNLLWYGKGSSWTFNADDVRTEYAEATRERFSHYIGNVRRDGGDYGVQELNPKGKWPDDVIKISIEAPLLWSELVTQLKNHAPFSNGLLGPAPTKAISSSTASAAPAPPPLDCMRPRTLRYPHHAQAPARHPRRKAVRRPEPR